jgi:hypothetical protein
MAQSNSKPKAYRVKIGKWPVLIDAEDLWILKDSPVRWYIVESGVHVKHYHVSRRRLGVTEKLHRLILKAPDGVEVDHINGNALDNRRQNLRLATHAENMHNRVGTNDLKGVRRKGKRYYASIEMDGRFIHCGVYDTPEEAARAYDRKAIELFGEFACTNESCGMV